MGCSDIKGPEPQTKKNGCICKDGTRIVQNENLLIYRSYLVGNPCWDKGGIESYF